jgi:membrane protein YqaA with SNARE-associated domain
MPQLRAHLLFCGYPVTWLDLLLFLPLAFLSNTALPLSFDPVLIYFASRTSISGASALALIGGICAGAGAVADVTLLRCLRRKTSERWLGWMPYWKGRRFYVSTFFVALLPLPFTIVRLAVLRHPPRSIPYAIAVGLGRLPRYLATVYLWAKLGLPSGSNEAFLLAGLMVAILQIIRGRNETSQRACHGPKLGSRIHAE